MSELDLDRQQLTMQTTLLRTLRLIGADDEANAFVRQLDDVGIEKLITPQTNVSFSQYQRILEALNNITLTKVNDDTLKEMGKHVNDIYFKARALNHNFPAALRSPFYNDPSLISLEDTSIVLRRKLQKAIRSRKFNYQFDWSKPL